LPETSGMVIELIREPHQTAEAVEEDPAEARRQRPANSCSSEHARSERRASPTITLER
jgi:hypothetical protein